MKNSRSLSRRSFLARSAGIASAGLAMPVILPNGVLTSQGQDSPNERIGIGMIGVGRRAQQLMHELPKGAQIVAIADINEKRMAELSEGKSWTVHPDYRKMLESADVDAVIVATPDHWHAFNAIHACQAGKDVYCEKPMTLTVREGRAMVEAARKHKRIVQTGSQQRSMQACRVGCELVRNGRAGKIHTIHGNNYPSPWTQTFPKQPVPEGLNWDMWLGQAPVRDYHIDIYTPRAKPGWISLQPYSGGEMTGWGSHGLDIMQWAIGMDESGPVEVWPEGEGLTCEVGFRYADGIVVKLDNKGPAGGGLFVGEKGEILVDRGKYEVKPADLGQDPISDPEIRLAVSDHHLQNWLDCIRSRETPIADVEIGHRSATMCHLGNIARWTGRKLRWDPDKEEFPGDAEANSLLERTQRAPWQQPVI